MKIIRLLIGLFLLASGCVSVSVFDGTYRSELHPDNSIQFIADGQSYLLNNSGHLSSGTYRLGENNTVILIGSLGQAQVVSRNGNVLTDKDGERWIKK